MKQLSNTQIDKYFKGDIRYQGCYCKDQLPSTSKSNTFYLINLDDSTDSRAGTHWTFVYIKPKQCLYFDAFGVDQGGNFQPIRVKTGASDGSSLFCLFLSQKIFCASLITLR